MNEVIEKLYEIEENAANIMKNAERFKEECKKQAEQEQKRLTEELEQELSGRLTQSRKGLDDAAQGKIQAMEEDYQRQTDRLHEIYDGHLDELSEEIFHRITAAGIEV